MASQIIVELKAGSVKERWVFLRILILFFIAGYIGFWVFLPREATINELMGGGVFLLGGIFVLVSCWLMLRTVRDIKRLAVLEVENITDPLLGIYNRRYMEQRLKEEITRTERYSVPLSLLFLDIDHFKQVNDQYGHSAGDAVLSSLGQIINKQIRKSDLAARYGGEEIVILLTNTGQHEAVSMAERLRLCVEQTSFTESNMQGGALHCTVSIGIASLLEGSCEALDLVHRADLGMYHAKQTGRNRVVLYSEDL